MTGDRQDAGGGAAPAAVRRHVVSVPATVPPIVERGPKPARRVARPVERTGLRGPEIEAERPQLVGRPVITPLEVVHAPEHRGSLSRRRRDHAGEAGPTSGISTSAPRSFETPRTTAECR